MAFGFETSDLPASDGFMNPTLPLIEVGGIPGLVFEGELPDTFCFVPASCVRVERGETNVSELDYVRSHWDERNMRVCSLPEGKRLFPKPNHPVRDIHTGPVRSFLARIRSGWPNLSGERQPLGGEFSDRRGDRGRN